MKEAAAEVGICWMVVPRLFLISLILAPFTLAEHVWVEGESGQASNVRANSWYLSVRKGDLSGGNWLASYGGNQNPTAVYQVEVPKAARYVLWVRGNPVSAVMHVQVGSGADWTKVPISEAKHDQINIAEDGKPDMRFLAWSKAGTFQLNAGALPLTFRLSSPNGRHGAIDCFCLTTDEAWRPQKTFQPGADTTWPAPKLDDANLREWGDFIQPSDKDLGWRQVRWHRHLDEAAAEAQQLDRPVLLWAMNGHPCGET